MIRTVVVGTCKWNKQVTIGGDRFSLLKSKDMDLNCVVSSFFVVGFGYGFGFGLELTLFFSLFFITNAGQTSLNPSMNRDQQRREMGGPLVRWRQIPTFLYTNTTWKTQRHPSFFFVLQSTTDVPIFVVNYFSKPHNVYFSCRMRRKAKEERREPLVCYWLAGSVLESWVLVLAPADWLTGCRTKAAKILEPHRDQVQS